MLLAQGRRKKALTQIWSAQDAEQLKRALAQLMMVGGDTNHGVRFCRGVTINCRKTNHAAKYKTLAQRLNSFPS
jgi:hypothetical protein